MARARALIGVVAALLALAPEAARAEGCPAQSGRPVRVAVVGPADLGVLPEACEATEASLEMRGAVLVATTDLYGSLQAGVGLRGRATVAERTWISLWAPSLEYRFVANATVESERVSRGGAVVGVHHRIDLPAGWRTSVAPFVRLLLPLESGYENARQVGVEHGIAARTWTSERTELVWGWGFTLASTWNGARALHLLSESVSTDLVVHPWGSGRGLVDVAGGLALRFALADPRPFESFDPRLSVRLHPIGDLWIALSGIAPLWGRDRTDVGAALQIGYGR